MHLVTHNRQVTIVVGGQYGSEGKGKMVSHLAIHDNPAYVVRSGGPNAGHCVWYKGEKIPLKQIPAGILNPNANLRIAAGSLINMDILRYEMEKIGIGPDRLKIDGRAFIMTPELINVEREIGLVEKLSSTASGTGIATATRVMREDGDKYLARNCEEIQPFIVDVAKEINDAVDKGKEIIIEGTQGFGLSLYHSQAYPKTTSRDTTASAFASECGIGPMAVKDVVMVVRTYPIRVAGAQAGPLKNEISWDDVQRESGYLESFVEMTSVSKKVRRVGLFDIDLVKEAVMYNRPTMLGIHGIDYIDHRDVGKRDFDDLTSKSKDFLAMLQDETGIPIKFIFTGQKNEDIIDLR